MAVNAAQVAKHASTPTTQLYDKIAAETRQCGIMVSGGGRLRTARREAVLLLFDSVDVTVGTFCWISFACAQGRIETE